MKRIKSTLTILEFACRAVILVWQEPKITVAWQRIGKQINLSIDIYNHLFDDEAKETHE